MSSVAVRDCAFYDRGMMQLLFRASQSIAMRGLFAILLVAFIAFGIGDVLRAHGNSGDVATVGKEAISPQQLSQAFQQQMAELGRRFGGKVDPAAAKRAGFLERVLDAQINDMLVGLAAHDQGFVVDGRLVAEEIRQAPAFQDPATKAFSRELFDRYLAQQRLTESDAIHAEQLSLSKRLLTNAELGPLHAPTAMVDLSHRFQGETRRGQIVHVDPASMVVPAPTMDQLTDYYHKHEAAFTSPEYRDFSFLAVDAADLAKSVSVSPDELQQAYDARQKEFQVPERRLLSQIVLKDEGKAFQLASAARSGKSLAAAAKDVGVTEQPAELGLMGRQDLPDALQEPVFAASANTVLSPIKTAFGWHVIAVGRVEAGHQLSFEEAKSALTADLKGEKASDLLATRSKEIDDKLAGGAGLAEAGNNFNLTPISVKAVDAKGKHPDGTPASELIDHAAALENRVHPG